MKEKAARKTPQYSDIDLAGWKERDDIITDSLWMLESRDRKNGHKLDYHGNFIPQIAYQILQRYTRKGDVVVDWFLGSGTSAIEAANQDRRIVGVELKRDLITHVRSKLPSDKLDKDIHLVCGDSTKATTQKKVTRALMAMGEEKAHLAVLHPPYADIIKFSDNPNDLSNSGDTKDFVKKFKRVAKNAYETLAEGRFAVLVIGDKYAMSELDPLGFKCLQAMNEVGFRTKSIVVKNIEGNEMAKGRDNNLWRYRALAGGFYIFKHEYVMVFFK